MHLFSAKAHGFVLDSEELACELYTVQLRLLVICPVHKIMHTVQPQA